MRRFPIINKVSGIVIGIGEAIKKAVQELVNLFLLQPFFHDFIILLKICRALPVCSENVFSMGI